MVSERSLLCSPRLHLFARTKVKPDQQSEGCQEQIALGLSRNVPCVKAP